MAISVHVVGSGLITCFCSRWLPLSLLIEKLFMSGVSMSGVSLKHART